MLSVSWMPFNGSMWFFISTTCLHHVVATMNEQQHLLLQDSSPF